MVNLADEWRSAFWQRWSKSDYSWEGLRKHVLTGSGGPYGEQTLQDYWRRDPAKPTVVRDDKELRAAGELVDGKDGQVWHIVHLPAKFPNSGLTTWKTDDSANDWERLDALIDARLNAANAWSSKRPIKGTEYRAMLGGAVLRSLGSRTRDDVFRLDAVNCAFLQNQPLRRKTFAAGGSFAGALFDKGAFFSFSTFEKFSFEGVTIAETSWFLKVGFQSAKFDDAKLEKAHFSGAKIEEEFSCSRAHFLSRASFRDVEFSGAVKFAKTVFGDVVDFSSANFAALLDCSDAIFNGRANFAGSPTSDITPEQRHQIRLSVLPPGADESDSDEEESDALVEKILSGETIIPSTSNALRWRAFRLVRFSGARFHDDANFSNRTFLASTDFSQVSFRQVAEFHDAKLHQDTSFAGATFSTPLPARIKDEGADGAVVERDANREERNTHFERYERAFRTLKLAMEGHRARREESRFFRKELEARRLRPSIRPVEGGPKEVTISEKVVSHLYERVSGFGDSLLIPLLWLSALWGGSAIVYSLLVGDLPLTCTFLDSGCRLSPATVIAAERTWFPLANQSAQMLAWLDESTRGVELLAAVIGIIHRIIAAILIFLFALAIRRKFQIS